MLKFFLFFITLLCCTTIGSAQTLSEARLRNLKACLVEHAGNAHSNPSEKDAVFRACFLQSIRMMSVDSMVLLVKEDQEFSAYFSGIRAQFVRGCSSFYQFLERTEQASKKNQQGTQIGSTNISFEEVSPDPYKVLVLSTDSAGVLVKVIYEDRSQGKSVRNIYPLYYKEALTGYTNSKPFRLKYEPLERPFFYYDEPNIQNLNTPVMQYLPEKFNLQLHKGGFFYPLEFEVMRKHELNRKD